MIKSFINKSAIIKLWKKFKGKGFVLEALQKINLPNEPLSQYQLNESIQTLLIPSFRGIFMRDALPAKPMKKKCGILNLDIKIGNRTHWTCWY